MHTSIPQRFWIRFLPLLWHFWLILTIENKKYSFPSFTSLPINWAISFIFDDKSILCLRYDYSSLFSEKKTQFFHSFEVHPQQVLSCFSIRSRKFHVKMKRWNKYVSVQLNETTCYDYFTVRCVHFLRVCFSQMIISCARRIGGCNFKWFHKYGDILYRHYFALFYTLNTLFAVHVKHWNNNCTTPSVVIVCFNRRFA